jgi:protein-S-isoprenylcysteine O-methyltransferase Ste14
MARAAPGCAGPWAWRMKILGLVLLVSGWAIVLTSVALLTEEVPRAAFVLAGVGVEIVGLALLIRAHRVRRSEHE